MRLCSRAFAIVIPALLVGACSTLDIIGGRGEAPDAKESAQDAKVAAEKAAPPKSSTKPSEDDDVQVLSTPAQVISPAPEKQPLAPEAIVEAPAPAVAAEKVEPVAEEALPPNTFIVKAAKKNQTHPSFGQGSAIGFEVNGVQGKDIVVRRGESYTFRVRTNVKHDFYLSRKPVGSGTAVFADGVSGQFTYKGDVVFTPGDDTPETLYYQCRNHKFMGGRIVVVAKDADIEAIAAKLADERRTAQSKVESAAKGPVVTEVKAKQKLAYVKMLLQFKANSLTAEQKQSAQAKLAEAEKALAAEDYNSAYAIADEAGQLFAPSPATRGPSESELAEMKQQYEAKLEGVRSFQDSHQRSFTNAQKSTGDIQPVDYDHDKVDRLMQDADALAEKKDYPAAEKKLAQAEREITQALNAMLGSKTIVFELKFDTPADEYQYELDRYNSYLELIPKAIEVRKPSQGAINLAQRYVDKGKFFAGKASESAQGGRHDEAIVVIKDATKEVRRGLMILGVSM